MSRNKKVNVVAIIIGVLLLPLLFMCGTPVPEPIQSRSYPVPYVMSTELASEHGLAPLENACKSDICFYDAGLWTATELSAPVDWFTSCADMNSVAVHSPAS